MPELDNIGGNGADGDRDEQMKEDDTDETTGSDADRDRDGQAST